MDLKRKRIIFVSFVAILCFLCIGIISTHRWTNQAKIPNQRIKNHVQFYKMDEIYEMKINQILTGDFSTLQGKWKSNPSLEGIQFVIKENCVWYGNQRYFLSVKGQENSGAVALERPEIENAAPFIFYPKGTPIPVLLENGQIDRTGIFDPTDQAKDRIIMAQTILNKELIKSVTAYHE